MTKLYAGQILNAVKMTIKGKYPKAARPRVTFFAHCTSEYSKKIFQSFLLKLTKLCLGQATNWGKKKD